MRFFSFASGIGLFITEVESELHQHRRVASVDAALVNIGAATIEEEHHEHVGRLFAPDPESATSGFLLEILGLEFVRFLTLLLVLGIRLEPLVVSPKMDASFLACRTDCEDFWRNQSFNDALLCGCCLESNDNR